MHKYEVDDAPEKTTAKKTIPKKFQTKKKELQANVVVSEKTEKLEKIKHLNGAAPVVHTETKKTKRLKKMKKKKSEEENGEEMFSDDSDESDEENKEEKNDEDNAELLSTADNGNLTTPSTNNEFASLNASKTGTPKMSQGKTKLGQKHAKITQLTSSQLNLLASTTGAFRGPGDSYAMFLTTGKRTSGMARKALHSKLKATDLGDYDEILVEQSEKFTKISVARNPRMIDRLRKKHKEYIREELGRKTQVLEEIRIQIITSMKTLSGLAATLSQLIQENQTLKEKHAKMTLELV